MVKKIKRSFFIIFLRFYLNSDVVGRTSMGEGESDGVVDKVGGAIGSDASHGTSPFLRRPTPEQGSIGHGGSGAAAKGEDHEVLDAADKGELLLVVEDVCDGGGSRVGHGETAVNPEAGAGAVNGTDVGRLEPARLCPGGAADFPESEIIALALQRVGAGEDERGRASQIVARDQNRLHGVSQGHLLPKRLLHRFLHRRRGGSSAAAAATKSTS